MLTIKEFFTKCICEGHYVVKHRVNGFWVPLGGGTADTLLARYPDYKILGMYSSEGVMFLLCEE